MRDGSHILLFDLWIATDRFGISIGTQCEEIETCLNKNNSKRAYHLVKDLTSEKQGRPSKIQDRSGKCLTEEQEILSRWTEYCLELNNLESCGDNTVLDCNQPPNPEKDLQPILCCSIASLKKGNSAGVDNILADLVQTGEETMIDVLTEVCNRIWRSGEWPTRWTQPLIMTLPEKGSLQLCQNYQPNQSFEHSHAESHIEQAVKRITAYHHSADYIFQSFGIIMFIFSQLEFRLNRC